VVSVMRMAAQKSGQGPPAEESYWVDTLLSCDATPERGGAVAPADLGSQGAELRVIPVELRLLTALSTLRISIPSDLRPPEPRRAGAQQPATPPAATLPPSFFDSSPSGVQPHTLTHAAPLLCSPPLSARFCSAADAARAGAAVPRRRTAGDGPRGGPQDFRARGGAGGLHCGPGAGQACCTFTPPGAHLAAR
jgi:hypothetical protein